MIKVHRLNGSEITINAELIESIEAIPNTKINLITGNQYIVTESVEAVTELVKQYRQEINIKEEIRKQQII